MANPKTDISNPETLLMMVSPVDSKRPWNILTIEVRISHQSAEPQKTPITRNTVNQ